MAQYQLYWPPLSKTLKITAGVLFGIWLVSTLVTPVGVFAANYLYISKQAVVNYGQIWTLLTYALFHADFGHLFFNLFVLWIFGSELQQEWRPKTWWKFCVYCALGGGLFVLVSQLIFQTNNPTLGYSGVVMGVVAAYCWHNWRRRLNFFFVEMTGKTLLFVFIAIDFVMVFVGREPTSIAAHWGGMATGLLLVTGYHRPKKLKQRYKRWQQRRRFKVVQQDNPDRGAQKPQDRKYFN